MGLKSHLLSCLKKDMSQLKSGNNNIFKFGLICIYMVSDIYFFLYKVMLTGMQQLIKHLEITLSSCCARQVLFPFWSSMLHIAFRLVDWICVLLQCQLLFWETFLMLWLWISVKIYLLLLKMELRFGKKNFFLVLVRITCYECAMVSNRP